MALYKYTKSPVRSASIDDYKRNNIEDEVLKIKRKERKKLTLWDILVGLIQDFHTLIVSSKVAGITIPIALIVLGVVIVFKQVWPEVEDSVKLATGYYDTYNTPLVAGDYVERAKYLSDPGSEYFRTLSNNAREVHAFEPDPVSNQYSGRFELSLPSLELYNLPVTANVDSGVKEAYNTVLSNGLAHFQGSGLPISEVDNNIVIYGHSSSVSYYNRTRDVVAAFTKLTDIKIGDEVNIKMDGKEYNYRIVRSKIVEPSDIEIVLGTPGQDTLTLFTCYPPGNFSHRFVVVAKPI